VSNPYSIACPRIQQPGTTKIIMTNDPRVYDVDFRNGSLWYCNHGGRLFGGPSRTSVFWYQLNPNAGLNNPFVQSGFIDLIDVWHCFPSIAVNCAGDMLLGFTRGSTTRYAEAAYAYRLASDPLGTTRPVEQLKAGEDSYEKDFSTGDIRWGNYSATVVDPLDDRSMWTIQEYAAADVGPAAHDDRWGTWWGRLATPAPACAGDINNDGATNAADFTILAGNFGASVTPNTNGDLNADGLVNAADFVIFAGDFGCGP
jgi:hypothetical protein